LWLHSLKVAQLLRSAACLHTNQSRSYLNHLVKGKYTDEQTDRHDVNEDEFILIRSSNIEHKSEIRGNLLSDNNRFSYQHYMQKKRYRRHREN